MAKFKVTNILADGTVIDDMTGYVVPYNDDTKALYRFIANFLMKEIEKEVLKSQGLNSPKNNNKHPKTSRNNQGLLFKTKEQ